MQVVLVAAVGLDAVDAERDERPDPPLVLGDDGRVAEVEHLVAGVLSERLAADSRRGRSRAARPRA